MKQEEAIEVLRGAHYHLMDRKNYWYSNADRKASWILCVLASDIQAGFERAPGWWLYEVQEVTR